MVILSLSTPDLHTATQRNHPKLQKLDPVVLLTTSEHLQGRIQIRIEGKAVEVAAVPVGHSLVQR